MGSDDYVLLPRRLTAENGAKAALIGEFSERITCECSCCYPDGNADEDCEYCDGSGDMPIDVAVSWNTIKRIHDAVVAKFAKDPT